MLCDCRMRWFSQTGWNRRVMGRRRRARWLASGAPRRRAWRCCLHHCAAVQLRQMHCRGALQALWLPSHQLHSPPARRRHYRRHRHRRCSPLERALHGTAINVREQSQKLHASPTLLLAVRSYHQRTWTRAHQPRSALTSSCTAATAAGAAGAVGSHPICKRCPWPNRARTVHLTASPNTLGASRATEPARTARPRCP